MKQQNIHFHPASILLPDAARTDMTKWAVVACDQYTGEPEYWHAAEALVKDAPSTLRLILPEAFLHETEARVPVIQNNMQAYLNGILREHGDAMLLLERTQSDGKVRRGLIGAIDLEQYDYHAGSTSRIRATEGTVLERIPPRVAVRRGAPIELPHVMLLIDDRARSVIEPIARACTDRAPLYDFDLMQSGGHARACALTRDEQNAVQEALGALITPRSMKERYGSDAFAPLLFAVGDGNHSLATAKAVYEELKQRMGEDALSHPARYALCEVVNLHDEALEFEPIYRVVTGIDPEALLQAFRAHMQGLHGTAGAQSFTVVTANGEEALTAPTPEAQLSVGTLQAFLNGYTALHPEAEVDYIHGEDVLRTLAAREGAVGFLFDGMHKNELFQTVLCDGALPRKTFSMGHAADKRFYIEARRIQ